MPNMKTKKDIPPQVREFFAEIGRKNGTKLFQERGSEYFRKIAGMRKTHGRQKPPEPQKEAQPEPNL